MFLVEEAYNELYAEMTYNKIFEKVCDDVYNKKISFADAEKVMEAAASRLVPTNQTAYVQDVSKSAPHCSAACGNFYKLFSQWDDLINKFKSTPKNSKIKVGINFDDALKKIDKEIPNVLHAEREFAKGSKTGKVVFAASQIIGYMPPLTFVPGSTEMTYGILSVLDFLLEWKRRFQGSNRSALAKFAYNIDEACKQMKYDRYNMNDSVLDGTENIARAVVKWFNYLSSNMKKMIGALLRGVQRIGVETANASFKAGAAVGGKILDKAAKYDLSDRTSNSKVYKIGKALKDTGEELNSDVKQIRQKQSKIEGERNLRENIRKKEVEKIDPKKMQQMLQNLSFIRR